MGHLNQTEALLGSSSKSHSQVTAGCQLGPIECLHDASPHGLGFLTTWWLCSKSKHPEREWTHSAF